MNALDVIVKQSDEKISQLKDHLSEGKAKSFEERLHPLMAVRECDMSAIQQIVANAMGNGMVTGPTEAEVIHYDVEIKRMDSMPEI